MPGPKDKKKKPILREFLENYPMVENIGGTAKNLVFDQPVRMVNELARRLDEAGNLLTGGKDTELAIKTLGLILFFIKYPVQLVLTGVPELDEKGRTKKVKDDKGVERKVKTPSIVQRLILGYEELTAGKPVQKKDSILVNLLKDLSAGYEVVRGRGALDFDPKLTDEEQKMIKQDEEKKIQPAKRAPESQKVSKELADSDTNLQSALPQKLPPMKTGGVTPPSVTPAIPGKPGGIEVR